MLLLKLLLTLWILVLVPVYWVNYGPQNFLWFSDIGLFGTAFALWLESPLLMSIMALITLPVELAWNVDFFVRIFANYSAIGIAQYMFESRYSLFLRSLSLFHIVTPVVWIWYILQWGYDPRALPYAIFVCWVTLLLTYIFTTPEENINWVFNPAIHNWQWISSQAWLLLLMSIFPILYWLFHMFFLFLTNQKYAW